MHVALSTHAFMCDRKLNVATSQGHGPFLEQVLDDGANLRDK